MTIQAIYWYNGSNTVNICLLQVLHVVKIICSSCSTIIIYWENIEYMDLL